MSIEGGRVRVCIRIRPLLDHETKRGDQAVVACPDPSSVSVTLPSHKELKDGPDVSRTFRFDLACHEGFHQAAMFDHSGVVQLVDCVLEGMKATILAYGATSSGKTYTMSGLDQTDGTREGSFHDPGAQEGLIPRAVRYLWSKLDAAAQDGTMACQVLASYCEVYNEQVFDLLHLTGKPLPVRHQPHADEFYVPGLFEVQCECLEDVMEVLVEGHANRRRASHDLNQDSSRSHSLLSLNVLLVDSAHPHAGDGGIEKRGKIVFVDLAGSERLKRSNSESPEETGAINKSLFNLAKVISILSDYSQQQGDSRAAPHIPYRDSTLTKLLSDALGGNALALFIACASPALGAADETMATLQYSSRARSIKNRPLVQIAPSGAPNPEAELKFLRAEVVKLRVEAEKVPLFEYEINYLKKELENVQSLSLGQTSNTGEGLDGHVGVKGSIPSPLGRRIQAGKLVSQEGKVMIGRPPPGAAGRDLREAHERIKVLKADQRRTERALAAAAARETTAKKDAAAARQQLQQLQQLQQQLKMLNSSPATLSGGLPHADDKRHRELVTQLAMQQQECVAQRQELTRLQAENHALGERASSYLERAHALEAAESLSEQSISQLQHLNKSLQQQLREREEQMLDLTMELDRLRAAGLWVDSSPSTEMSEDLSNLQRASLQLSKSGMPAKKGPGRVIREIPRLPVATTKIPGSENYDSGASKTSSKLRLEQNQVPSSHLPVVPSASAFVS